MPLSLQSPFRPPRRMHGTEIRSREPLAPNMAQVPSTMARMRSTIRSYLRCAATLTKSVKSEQKIE
eukprot:4042723-Pleurochrysis_carterae.AAC.1